MPESESACETVWIQNVSSLFGTNLLVTDLCESNNINAFSRATILGLFLSALLFPMIGFSGLGLVLLILLFTYSRWLFAKINPDSRNVLTRPKKIEGFSEEIIGVSPAATITKPTARNPFMNVLLDEIKYNPTRPSADDITDPTNKVELDNFFRVQWNSDPTDVFGRSQSQREFYTMPSTSIPNDQESFQNWLYLLPGKTCKEGGRDACVPGTNGAVIPWLSKPN